MSTYLNTYVFILIVTLFQNEAETRVTQHMARNSTVVSSVREKRVLLFRLPPGVTQLRKSLRLPQLLKLFDCRRSVASEMVIRVGKNYHATLPHLVAEIYPTAEFNGAINNGLIPGRLLFNSFAITEPSDVSPVRSDRIEFEFCGARHPRVILKH